MKIVSYNINGLRNAIKKGHLDTLLDKHKPDILCLQEVRHNDPKPIEYFKYSHFHCAEKKGYSGTSISCNFEPLQVYRGFEALTKNGFDDTEGRIISIEHEDFILVSAYFPNSKPDLSRLHWRVEWDRQLSKLLDFYQKRKPVIMCGDVNVAHHEIDIYSIKGKARQHGFTKEERDSYSKLLKDNNLLDVYRELHPSDVKFTWWSNFANSRERNAGWRIDSFLISKSLLNSVSECDIDDKHLGSDHAPITLRLNKKTVLKK